MNFSKKPDKSESSNLAKASAFPALVMAITNGAILIDQLIKRIIISRHENDSYLPSEIIVPGWNTGINFGLFSGDETRQQFFIALGIVLSFGALTYAVVGWAMRALSSRQSLGLSLVAGGGISNIIDRFTYGAVFDFLSPQCCGFENPWSFNLADIFIFVGIVIFVIPSNKIISYTHRI